MPLRDDPNLAGSICAAEVERTQNAVAIEDGLPIGLPIFLAQLLPVPGLMAIQQLRYGRPPCSAISASAAGVATTWPSENNAGGLSSI